MTWRETASRRLNTLTGGPSTQLLCSRVYFNARVWGGGWIPLNQVLDVMFWHENQHCRQCYLWEMRYGETYESSIGAAQEEAPTVQA